MSKETMPMKTKLKRFKLTATVIDTCVRVVEAENEEAALERAEAMNVDEWREWSNHGAYIDDYEVEDSK